MCLSSLLQCPGGYDDDQYVRCSFREVAVHRPAWTVTQWETAAASAPMGKSAGKSKAAPSPSKSQAPPQAVAAAKSAAAAIQVAMPGDDD